MEVCVERMIEKPFESLESVLGSGLRAWLPGPVEGDPSVAELDVRLGRARIARRVLVRSGGSCWRSTRRDGPRRALPIVVTLARRSLAQVEAAAVRDAETSPEPGPVAGDAAAVVARMEAEADRWNADLVVVGSRRPIDLGGLVGRSHRPTLPAGRDRATRSHPSGPSALGDRRSRP